MVDRVLVDLVGIIPTGVQFGFPDRLFEERQGPIGRDGPRPHQRLVKHPFRLRVGQVGDAVTPVQLLPTLSRFRPRVWDLR